MRDSRDAIKKIEKVGFQKRATIQRPRVTACCHAGSLCSHALLVFRKDLKYTGNESLHARSFARLFLCSFARLFARWLVSSLVPSLVRSFARCLLSLPFHSTLQSLTGRRRGGTHGTHQQLCSYAARSLVCLQRDYASSRRQASWITRPGFLSYRKRIVPWGRRLGPNWTAANVDGRCEEQGRH